MEWLKGLLTTAVGDRTLTRSQADAIWAFSAPQPSFKTAPSGRLGMQHVLFEWVGAGLINPPQAQALADLAPEDHEPWEPPGGLSPAPDSPPPASVARLKLSPMDLFLAMLVGVSGYVMLVLAVVRSDGLRAVLFGSATVATGVTVWRTRPRTAPPDEDPSTLNRALCGDALMAAMVCAAIAFAEICAATGFLEKTTNPGNLVNDATFTQVDSSWVVFSTALLLLIMSIFGMLLVFRPPFAGSAVICLGVCSGVIDQHVAGDWSALHTAQVTRNWIGTCALVMVLAVLPRIPRGARRFFLLAGALGAIAVAGLADGGHDPFLDALAIGTALVALVLGVTMNRWELGRHRHSGVPDHV